MICGDCGHDENVHDSKTEKCDLWDDEGTRCPCNGFCEPDESILVNPDGSPAEKPQVFGTLTPLGFVHLLTGIASFDDLIEECANEGVRRFHEYRKKQKQEQKPPVKSGSRIPDTLREMMEDSNEQGQGTVPTSERPAVGGNPRRADQEEN